MTTFKSFHNWAAESLHPSTIPRPPKLSQGLAHGFSNTKVLRGSALCDFLQQQVVTQLVVESSCETLIQFSVPKKRNNNTNLTVNSYIPRYSLAGGN